MGKFLFGCFLCIPLLILITVRIVAFYTFSLDCGGYMKLAAHANSIELAAIQMEKVVDFAEQKHLTEGYCTIFLRQPKNDVGFWYQNMTTSLAELKMVNSTTSSLERSNILMKLRETLIDDSGESTSLNLPEGISIFPLNATFFWFAIVFSVVACVGVAFMIVAVQEW